MQQRSCYTQSIHKARIQCKEDNGKNGQQYHIQRKNDNAK